jgi:hypothetical protein
VGIRTDNHLSVAKPLIGIERYWYNNENQTGHPVLQPSLIEEFPSYLPSFHGKME